jgi:hypothetical protein
MHEKLGPARTIAKESQERKENSSKKAGKTQFFGKDVEIPAKKRFPCLIGNSLQPCGC